jgi:hypothetical protein
MRVDMGVGGELLCQIDDLVDTGVRVLAFE